MNNGYFFTFLCLFATTFTMASTPKFNSPLGVVLNHKIFKESAENRVVAQNITEIYRMMRRGKVDLDLVKETLKKTKHLEAFGFTQEWLKNIKKIEKSVKLEDIVNNCLLSRDLAQKPLGRVLTNSVEKFCFYKIKFLQERINTEKSLNVILQLEPFFKKRNVFLSMIYQKTDEQRLKKIILLLKEKRSEDYYNAVLAEKMIQIQRIKINREKYSTKEFEQFFNWYKNLPIKISKRNLILDKTIQLAISLDRHHHDESSRKLLKYINKKTYSEDALYAHLWSFNKKNKFQDALENVIYPFKLNLVSKINSTKLRFWIGNIHYKLGKYKMAQAFFENIIQTEPYSYYSVISNKLLLKMSPDYQDFLKKQISVNHKNIKIDPDKFSTPVKHSFARLKAWSILKNHLFLKAELNLLRKLKGTTPDKEEINLLAATILTQDQNYLNSFQIIYKHLTTKQEKPTLFEYGILFPRPFFKKIHFLSKNKIDSTVILSLIRQESGFNPSARSPVGARGLMQLMPRTARQMRRGVASKQLYRPQTNLKLGIKYFNRLLKKHKGNVVYALSAYNAGSHRVERWKKTYFKDSTSILHTIESIPFEETRNYVKLIYRNIFYYKLLQNPLEVTTTQDLNRISDVGLGFKH